MTSSLRPEQLDALLQRVCGEYMEMPGLRLSLSQAGRLWGLDLQTCETVLAFLVARRFLHRTTDGRFARLTDGRIAPTPPLRMARAASTRGPKRQRA
jgi:hypothetical protein